MRSTKNVDLIGHIKFLLWRQLDGCRVTRPFLSAKGVAWETIAYTRPTIREITIFMSLERWRKSTATLDFYRNEQKCVFVKS